MTENSETVDHAKFDHFIIRFFVTGMSCNERAAANDSVDKLFFAAEIVRSGDGCEIYSEVIGKLPLGRKACAGNKFSGSDVLFQQIGKR